MKTVDFYKIIGYFSFNKGKSQEIHVLRDWKISLTIFAILLIVIFTINGYIFWLYGQEVSVETEVGSSRVLRIDNESLQKIVDEIKKKEEVFEENLVAPKIKDPSVF